MRPSSISTLAVLGATGDLSGRYLFPALLSLAGAGHLAPEVRLVGASHEPLAVERFRQKVAERLARHAGAADPVVRERFVRALGYERVDASDAMSVCQFARRLSGPVLFYLALPPALFEPVLRGVGWADVAEGSRVVVEKPFGHDLASARRLNMLLHARFSEEAIFRMDHFLGHETVQNVLGLRFANSLLADVWDREHIASVDIVWDETLTLEGRAAYYDRAGALVDMIQSHLLQLLTLVAMEPPGSLSTDEFREHKLDVLQAIPSLSPGDVTRWTRRGRYTRGILQGRPVPDYVSEPGVDPARDTETFAQVTLQVENPRWRGVPFVLRTGKALAEDRCEIRICFRPLTETPFASAPLPNRLRLSLSPDRISLRFNINGPGDPRVLELIELTADLPASESPYARLLLDALRGDMSLSIHGDEAEASWRIVEPILAAWRANLVPLVDYPAGSEGPSAMSIDHRHAHPS